MTNNNMYRFPGISPYKEEQEAIFFGREQEVEDLYYGVTANSITLIYGESGCGKTSLINCGLIPRLSKDGLTIIRLRLVDKRGNNDKVLAILEGEARRKTLGEVRRIEVSLPLEDGGDERAACVFNAVANSDLYVNQEKGNAAKANENANVSTVVIIFDQFEEAFTKIGSQDRERLIGLISALKRNKKCSAHIVISLRQEYVGHLSLLSERIMGVFSAPFKIDPLNKTIAEEVIRKAAALPQDYEAPSGDWYHFRSRPFEFEDSERIIERCLLRKKGKHVDTFLLQMFCSDIERRMCCDGAGAKIIREKDIPDKWFIKVKADFYTEAIESIRGNAYQARARKLLQNELLNEYGMRQLKHREDILKTLCDCRQDNTDSANLRSAEEALKVLLDKRILREEAFFTSLRYEISHDALAEVILEEREKEHQRQGLKRVASILSAMVVFAVVGWIIINGLSDSYKKQVIKAQYDLQDTISDRDKALDEVKFARKELEKEQNAFDVTRLLQDYAQRKWVDRNDQAAVLQALQAYEELKRRRSGDNLPSRFSPDDRFFAAFNNSLTKVYNSPVFSRSFKAPIESASDFPVAFVPGTGGHRPLMAYADTSGLCVMLRGVGSATESRSCWWTLKHTVKSLAFSPTGKYLVATTTGGISLIEDPDPNVTPAELPVIEGSEKISSILFSDDERLLLYTIGNQVFITCRAQKWSQCSSLQLKEWGAGYAVTKLAITAPEDGVRVLAVGGGASKSGEGVLSVFELKDALEAGRGSSGGMRYKQWCTFPDPGGVYPKSALRDDRSVIGLRFLSSRPVRLVVVHKDTRLFLVTSESDGGEAIRIDISAKNGPEPSAEQNYEHYRALAFSPKNDLYAVFEDQIIKWSLAELAKVPLLMDLRVPLSHDLDALRSTDLPESTEPARKVEISVPLKKIRFKVRMQRIATEARNLRVLEAGTDMLVGQGYFSTWVWEQGGGRESKLVSRMYPPDGGAGAFGANHFYPQALAFGSDKMLYTGASHHGPMRWGWGDPAAFKPEFVDTCKSMFKGKPYAARALTLSPDGSLLAVAMGQVKYKGHGLFMVVNTKQPGKKPVCNVAAHGDGLWSTAFNHTGKLLVSGDWNGILALWDVKSDGVKLRKPYPVSKDAVYSLAFHPKYDVLALGTKSGNVSIFRIGDGAAENNDVALVKELFFPHGNIGKIQSVVFSQDGKWLAAAGARGPIQLWSVDVEKSGSDAQFTTKDPLPGHSGGTQALAFHPIENVLASGGADGKVRIWRPDSPDSIPVVLEGTGADVLSLAWGKEGEQLAASFAISPAEELPADETMASKGSGPVRHGKVLIWTWDLDSAERVACNTVWRNMYSKGEWDQWFKPIDAKMTFNPACVIDATLDAP